MFNGDDDFPMGAMHSFGQMHQQMMNEMNMMTGGILRNMGMGGFPGGMMGGPFGGIMGHPFGAITDGTGQPPSRRRQELEMNPFAPFGGLLGGLGGMGMMMPPPGQGANMYMSSSVMTIGPDGKPRVEQQTVRRHGDVTETKRRVDRNGESSMSIGHSIGDRSHFIDKKRDRDGNVRKQQRFVNLDEANAEAFDREFSTRVRQGYGGTPRSNLREIDNGSTNRRSPGTRRTEDRTGSRGAPIVTLPEEEEPYQSRSSTSHRIGGPLIREISEEEAEQTSSSVPKKRRGPI
uniref:Myeloid leukemia factor n=1 Tax=Caenorhabditis tropicalis TaxID=1561998 RepID=A0A1I7UUM9_9PELO